MSNVAIVADSASDLPRQLYQDRNITVVPLHVNWGGKTYRDGEDLVPATFYPRLSEQKDFPTTSQPTPGTYYEIYQNLLSQGKDVLCLTLSSGISGTYSSAITARDMVEHPQRVVVIDTLNASVGAGLLVLEASRLVEQGLGMDEIVSQLEHKVSRLHAIFTINNLENLVRGGRLSALQGGLGTLLDIKPVLYLNPEGKIMPLTKVRSRKKALAQLEVELTKKGIDLEGQTMGVCHAHDPETGAAMAQILKEKYGAAEVIVGEIGSVIGSHTGIGCIAIFFYGGVRA